MTTLRGALGNSALMFVSQLLTWTATLILTAALGRYLGVTGFGHLYLAFSLAAIFGVLIGFGLDEQLVRAVARDPGAAGPYLSSAIMLKLLLGVVAYIALLGTVRILGYDESVERVIGLYGLTLMSNSLSGSLTAAYQGLQRLANVAVGTVIEKVLTAVAALILLASGGGVIEIAAVIVIGSMVGALWKALSLARVARVLWTIHVGTVRSLLRRAPPFILYAIFGTIYYRMDTVLLSKMTDATVVGWYGAAYRLFDTMVFLPSIVAATVMFPILARLSEGSRAHLTRAIAEGSKVMLIAGVPIAAGLFQLAHPVVLFIYGGGNFNGAADALRWLAPGLLVLYLNSILGVALVSLNLERRLATVAVMAAVFNVGANIFLIPRYQHIGAAAVTSLTEVLVFSCLLLSLPRDLIPWSTLRVAARAAVAAAVMVIAVELVGSSHVMLLVAVGAMTYAVCGLLVGLVSPNDIAVVRDALFRRPTTQPDQMVTVE
jgi:O-antigen/teichoic acid export membrane protein